LDFKRARPNLPELCHSSKESHTYVFGQGCAPAAESGPIRIGPEAHKGLFYGLALAAHDLRSEPNRIADDR
jgi:hypothetical protein